LAVRARSRVVVDMFGVYHRRWPRVNIFIGGERKARADANVKPAAVRPWQCDVTACQKIIGVPCMENRNLIAWK